MGVFFNSVAMLLHAYERDKRWPYLSLPLANGERPEVWVPAEEAVYQPLHDQCSEIVQVGEEENGRMVDIFSTHSGDGTGKSSSELCNAKILSEELHALSNWKNQFLDAVTQLFQQLGSAESRKLNNKYLRIARIGWQFLLTPWRLLFAFVPPCHIAHGWIAFICSLIIISGIAYGVTKLSDQISCVTGISPYAIVFTALAVGTPWSDLVASKIAAQRQMTADSAIANITCRHWSALAH